MDCSGLTPSTSQSKLNIIYQLTVEADQVLRLVKKEGTLLGRNITIITEKTEEIQKIINEAQTQLLQKPNESLRQALKQYSIKLHRILKRIEQKNEKNDASSELQIVLQTIAKVFEKVLITPTHIERPESLLNEQITHSSEQIREAHIIARASQLLEHANLSSLDSIESEYLAAARELISLELFNTSSEVATTCQLLYYQAALEAFKDNPQRGAKILQEATKYLNFSSSHPMATIVSTISHRCENDKEKQAVGIAFSGLGAAAVKDLAMRVGLKAFQDKTQLVLEIKLNRQAISELNLCLKGLSSINWDEILRSCLPEIRDVEFCSFNFYVYCKSEKGFFNHSMEDLKPTEQIRDIEHWSDIFLIVDCERYRLKLPGFGYIIFPANVKNKSLADQIEVYIDNPGNYEPQDLLKKVQNLLTLVGCPPVLVESRNKDKAKRNLFHLYKTFSPQLAHALSHENGIFNLPIENIKEKFKEIFINKALHHVYGASQIEDKTQQAIEAIEEMEENLTEIEMVETFPGKLVPSFGISNAMRQLGALGMVLTVTGPRSLGYQDLIHNTLIMIKEGILPTTIRFSAGKIGAQGSSNIEDIRSGGGESVFCRLVTRKILENTTVDKYTLLGKPLILIIVDLEASNPANTYCSSHDIYGSRQEKEVPKRLSLLQLTANLNGYPNPKNEVMIRDHLPNRFIRHIVVMTNEVKDEMARELKEQNMLVEEEGTIFIKIGLDRYLKLDDFIIVKPETLTEDLWS